MSRSGGPAYERIPYLVIFEEQARTKDTYGGEFGRVVLKAQLLRPRDRPSRTVLLFMHPIGGGEYLPLPTALAAAGHHVIYCSSRYLGNDTALIMEKVAIDLGAAVRDARERLGYERVVLAGWSGGGSLSAFYQAQAERPTITSTPAGEPPDLVSAQLPPADGLMMLAAHVSRATTLTEWLDAAVLDEGDPETRAPELDLYDLRNPNQPPYTAEFLARYRAAQIARNRRITAWVRARLARLRSSGRGEEEFAFVVHGTMADPRWLDPSVDPSDRRPNWCMLGEPKLVNDGPVGLARFCTLRSWLSQWSYDESNADGPRSLAAVRVPLLVLGNSADDACTPSHTHRLYEAAGMADRTLVEIKGATHYYFGQKQQLAEAVAAIGEWLRARDFA